MAKKLLELDGTDVSRLLTVGLAAEGKVVKGVDWGSGAAPCARVEYESAPAVPGTVEQLTLRSVLVQKLAGLIEQAQMAGLPFDGVLTEAETWAMSRAQEAGRLTPVPAGAT